MSLIGISAKFIILLFIYALKLYILKLLINCKSYKLKSTFCGDFHGILRYSPHKTEFDNVSPVIRALYVVNLLFCERILIFWQIF